MRIWYSIRKPIGYIIFTALAYFALVVIHAIPYALTDWILGL